MHKLYLAISVLLMSVHATDWAMLVPSVLTRAFNSHDTIRKNCSYEYKVDLSKPKMLESEAFLESCFNKPLHEMPKNLCAMEKEDGIKMLCYLNMKHSLLLDIASNKDIRFAVVAQLFNGNTQVADFCCNLSLDEIKRLHDNAKKKMFIYPLKLNKDLDLQHYALLPKNEISILRQAVQNNLIGALNVNEFACAMRTLKTIDPSIQCSKSIVNSIKIDLSNQEHVLLFWNQPTPWSFYRIAALGGMALSFGLVADLFHQYEFYGRAYEAIGMSALTGFMAIMMTGCKFGFKYSSYCNDLKNNVLPNQPALTNYLKKRSS